MCGNSDAIYPNAPSRQEWVGWCSQNRAPIRDNIGGSGYGRKVVLRDEVFDGVADRFFERSEVDSQIVSDLGVVDDESPSEECTEVLSEALGLDFDCDASDGCTNRRIE